MATKQGNGIYIPVTVDTTGADKGMNDIQKRLKELDRVIQMASTDIEEMKDEMAKAAKSMDAQAVEEYKVAIMSAEKDLAGYVNEQRYLTKQLEESASSQEKETSETNKASVAHKSLKQELKETTQRLAELSKEGKKGSVEYNELAQKAGVMRDAMDDANNAIKHLASDTADLDAVMSAASLGTGGFTAVTGAMDLMGVSTDDVAEAQRKLQGAIAITTGVQSIQNALQKESALMLKVHNVQMTYATQKEIILRAARMQGVTVTKAQVAAQAALNTVMKANPVVLLLTALAGLAVVVGKIVSKTKEQAEAQREANEEMEKARIEANKQQSSEYTELAMMDALVRKASDVNNSYKSRMSAIEELNNKYPKLNASLKDENNQLQLNIQAYKDYKNAIVDMAMSKAYQGKLEESVVDRMNWSDKIDEQKSIVAEKKANWYAANDKDRKQAEIELNFAEATLRGLEKKYDEADSKVKQLSDEITKIQLKNKPTQTPTPATTKLEFGSDEWLQKTSEKNAIKYWDHFFKSLEYEASAKALEVPINIEFPEDVAEEEVVPDMIAAAQLRVEQTAEGTTERLQAELALQEQILALMVRNEGEGDEAFKLRVQRQKNAVKKAQRDINDKSEDDSKKKDEGILKWASVTVDAIGSIGDSLQKLGGDYEKVGKAISNIADVAGAVLGKLASGDVIGAVVAGVVSITTKLINAQAEFNKAAKENYKAIEEYRNKLKEIELSVDEMNNGFRSDIFGSISKSSENMKKTASIIGKYFDVSNISLKEMKEAYSQIEASIEATKAIGGDTTQLELILKYLGLYIDNLDNIQSKVSSIFGSLADDALDSIVNAIRTGANSWEDFRKAGSKAIEQLGEELIYSLFLAAEFDEFKENILGLFSGDMTEEEYSAAWEQAMDMMDGFLDGMQNNLDNASRFGLALKEKAAERGMDIFGSDAQSSAQGAISSVTEQTASLVAGQMNAIRMNQIDTNEIMRNQLMLLSGIKNDTAFIRSIDSRLERMENTYASRILNA